MSEIMASIQDGKAVIENPVIVKFVRTFTVLGKIKMIVKMRGSPHYQIHQQDLPAKETNNAELLLARMEGSDAYMVVKKVERTEGYIFCDVLRRSDHGEVKKELLDFILANVKGGKGMAGPVFVPIKGHERVNCAVRGAEKVWVVVEDNPDPVLIH
jgi:hypothetical protein